MRREDGVFLLYCPGCDSLRVRASHPHPHPLIECTEQCGGFGTLVPRIVFPFSRLPLVEG